MKDVQAVVEVLAETGPVFIMAFRSRLVAAITRKSQLQGLGAAQALHLLLLDHPEQLDLHLARGSSPTSSRKMVPPLASSKLARLALGGWLR